MMLTEILESIDGSVLALPSIDKQLRAVSTKFKADSPNAIDRICSLAVCVDLAGESAAAIKLLKFLDENVHASHVSRRDLTGSVAMARLMLVHIYSREGRDLEIKEILAKDDLRSTQNLETYDVFDYENVLQDRLNSTYKEFEFFDHDDETTKKDMLRVALVSYQQMIILHHRLTEISETSFDEDVERLPAALAYFTEKLRFYVNR